MREILFRAKRIDNGEWVEGFLFLVSYDGCPVWCIGNIPLSANDYSEIMGENVDWFSVDEEAICQYIGRNDKNGKRIWENDIVKHEQSDTIGTVKWYQEDYVGWCVDDVMIDEQQFTDEMWNECEVIGNIFDNKELLEVKNEL